MKKLVVIGALLAALAIAVWLVRSQPAGEASTAKSSQPASPSPPPPPPAARESADLATDAKPPDPVVLAPAVQSARTTDAPPAPINEQRARPTAAARTDEAKQLAECRARWRREHTAEQVARASETKDSGWAYATEQKLREYLSGRFKTIPIEVLGIDCRETFCEVKAQSFVPEGAHEFQTALAEVGKESWNDFSGSAFSQTEDASPVVYTGEVRRRRSYADTYQRDDDPELIACANLLGRQTQQARATRDAEPRDTGWADQMEQLLRMHLATQLTQHPVDQLEIICKTSFCQIKAKGKANEALLALQKAMAAVESEPWANMRHGEGGTSGYGDSWTADFTLIRR